MKRKVCFAAITLWAFLAACSAGSGKDNKASGTPKPQATVSAAPTVEPTAAPTPTAVPTPTPIPTIHDVLTESGRECVYDIPMDSFHFSNYDMERVHICYVNNCLVAVYPEFEAVDYVAEHSDGEDEEPFYVDWDKNTPFICEIKNLVTMETKTEHFSFDSLSSPYIELTPLKDGNFVISASYAQEHRIYNTNFELLTCYKLEDISTSGAYTCCWNSNEEMYYLQIGEDTIYKTVGNGSEGEVVLQDKSLKDIYGISFLSDDILLGYSNDFFLQKRFVIDVKSLSVDTIEYQTEDYYLSEDGKELLVNYCDRNVFELYDTEQCPIPFLNREYEKGKKYEPKATYSIGEYVGSWGNFSIDWKRRLMIWSEDYSMGSTTVHTYSCYSIDNGELHSSVNYRYETDYFYDQCFLRMEEGFLVTVANVKPLKFQAWDYTTEKDNNDYSMFVKTNYIPRELDEKRKALEEKYHIFFYLGPEIGSVLNDYIVTVSYNYAAMESALDTIDETLSLYPEGFLEQIKVGSTKTLGIYLCEGFTKNGPNSIDTAIAVASEYGYERLLILNIDYQGDSLAKNMIHEISHWIDKRIAYKMGDGNYDELWCALNPKDFKYCFSYVNCRYNWDYIYSLANKNNSYFVDSYSQTYPTEDRARMFEYLMYPSEYEDFFESEHILHKVSRYFELIREYFDTTGWPEVTVWEERLAEKY